MLRDIAPMVLLLLLLPMRARTLSCSLFFMKSEGHSERSGTLPCE
jgi:hypothetical protein